MKRLRTQEIEQKNKEMENERKKKKHPIRQLTAE